jgi:hypothetical protein
VGQTIYCAFAYDQNDPISDSECENQPDHRHFVIVRHVEISDEQGNAVTVVKPDSAVQVSIRYLCQKEPFRGHVFLRVATSDGYPLYTSYSKAMDFKQGEDTVKAFIPSFSLLRGEYRIWAGICGEGKEAERYHEQQMKLSVEPGGPFPDSRYGVFYNKVEWQIEKRRVSRIKTRSNSAAV